MFVQLSNLVTIEIPARNVKEQSNPWFSDGEKVGLQGLQLFEVLERVWLHFPDLVAAEVPIQRCGEWIKCSTISMNTHDTYNWRS